MKIKLNTIVAIFIFIALIFSAYSYYEDITDSGVCIVGNSCSKVRHSEYSSLFGFKVSLIGTIASAIYLITFLETIRNKSKLLKKSIYVISALALVFSIYFIYLQAFIIKAICPTCLIVDISILISSILILTKFR